MKLTQYIEEIYRIISIENMPPMIAAYIHVRDKYDNKKTLLVSKVDETFKSYLSKFFKEDPEGQCPIYWFVPGLNMEVKKICYASGSEGRKNSLERLEKDVQQVKKTLLRINSK